MQIIVNGEARDVAPGTTVEGLLLQLQLNPDTVVVEYDGRILSRQEYGSQDLQEDGVLELIRFVGGG